MRREWARRGVGAMGATRSWQPARPSRSAERQRQYVHSNPRSSLYDRSLLIDIPNMLINDKRRRHQQISDSSDSSESSDTNDDSDNSIMDDQARNKPVEVRKGIGKNLFKGVIHRVTRGTSPTGRNHRILSTSTKAQPNTSIINLKLSTD